jgi:hypothetical protein
MAKREGTGGGGFGWLILGLVLGVVATLAFQVFAHKGHVDESEASPSHVLAIAPPTPPGEAPAATLAHKHKHDADLQSSSGGPPAASHPVATDPENASQVADDAAAAGMTSRATN